MDINDIPKDVVIKFLDEYYPDIIHENDYDVLLELVLSGEIESAPYEIVNWMIAYNNKKNKNIKKYKLSDILLDKIDLFELYQIFNVNTKDDVIQILSYLHKLNDNLTIFNKLPAEVLKQILMDLDTESLLLWFKINTTTNFYSKDLLDNILRHKIELNYDIDTKILDQKKLIIFNKVIEGYRYYGVYHLKFLKIVDGIEKLKSLAEINKFNKERAKYIKNKVPLPSLSSRNISIITGKYQKKDTPKINPSTISMLPILPSFPIIEEDEINPMEKNLPDVSNEDIYDNKLIDTACYNLGYRDLIKILLKISDPLLNNIKITKDDRENVIQELLGNAQMKMKDGISKFLGTKSILYTYDELINMDSDKLDFIYNLIKSMPTKQYLCEVIKDKMSKLGLIEYL